MNRFKGTRGDDVIVSTDFNDIIRGLAGNDRLYGWGGNDRLYGGDGDDSLDGELGSDRLYGEDGADRLTDEDGGSDSLFGGAGDDTLVVTRQSTVAADRVSLAGDEGDDVLTFSDSYNGSVVATLSGGEGADRVTVAFGTATIDGGAGDDSLSVYQIAGGSVLAGDGDDVLELYDRGIFGQSANVLVDAGAGDDRVSIAGAKIESNFRVSLGDGTDTIALLPYGENALVANVEVQDFAAGRRGDHVDLRDFLEIALTRWNGGDPFASGHLRLAREDGGVAVQMDRDASRDAYSWETILQFADVKLAAFRAENFEGWDPRAGDALPAAAHDLAWPATALEAAFA